MRKLGMIVAGIMLLTGPVFAQDLTGLWTGNDGGTYYLRQVGDRIFWLGESGDGGRTWTNVATGKLSGGRIILDWGDVPKGAIRNSGLLVIRVEGDRLVRVEGTGGFGGSEWRRGGPPVAGPPAAGPSIQFAWVGQDADYVGTWGSGRPDGVKDGHFRLVLDLASPQEVQSIAVYSADARGTPQGGQVWHSRESRYWVLGVFHQGRQLNYSHLPTLGYFSGPATFDVYGNDSGWFKPGNYFLVEVTLGNGQKPRAVVQLQSVVAAGLVETLIVPNDKPVKILSRNVLERGQWYTIEASVEFSDWSHVKDGVDAVWCYAEWRCGRQGQAWDQLRIDGKGMTEIAGQPIPYNPQHVYRVRYGGQGRQVELYLIDAQGSWSDNSGSITVKIFKE
ncbi:MAG: hypothetical protein HYV08_18040 [Deltaproteobacteria bacterium]|nr:hypothetical protein [Deltaproteobacteria bacterium]